MADLLELKNLNQEQNQKLSTLYDEIHYIYKNGINSCTDFEYFEIYNEPTEIHKKVKELIEKLHKESFQEYDFSIVYEKFLPKTLRFKNKSQDSMIPYYGILSVKDKIKILRYFDGFNEIKPEDIKGKDIYKLMEEIKDLRIVKSTYEDRRVSFVFPNEMVSKQYVLKKYGIIMPDIEPTFKLFDFVQKRKRDDKVIYTEIDAPGTYYDFNGKEIKAKLKMFSPSLEPRGVKFVEDLQESSYELDF